MTKEEIVIGVIVVRSKGDYVVGRMGPIIATRKDHLGREQVQVDWVGGPRTWVNIKVVELQSKPYEIVFKPSKHGGTDPVYKAL